MKGFLLTLAFVTVAVMLVSLCILAVRQLIALIKGDQNEFNRLTTPYDVAEMMAEKDFGVSPRVFDLMWNDLKATRPEALPWDLYLKIKGGK